jgi:hypothetical protein
MLRILDPLCEKIVLIGGHTSRIKVMSERVEVRDIGVGLHYVAEKKPTVYSTLLWMVKCILAQIRTSIELVKVRRDVDLVLFYMANPFYFIPVITSKLLKKVTIDVVTRNKRTNLISRIMDMKGHILLKLFGGISPEASPNQRIGVDKIPRQTPRRGRQIYRHCNVQNRKECG